MGIVRPYSRWANRIHSLYLQLAASGMLPPPRGLPQRPGPDRLAVSNHGLTLEIVTHCWQYAPLLAYQLSSFVLYPPKNLSVQVTVFHSLEDDATCELLARFSGYEVPGIRWNWAVLDTPHLMRRAIGRNLAALATTANWVWFTDCDVIFHEGCLDGLADQLRGCRSILVYPREERCTSMLPESDPMLTLPRHHIGLLEIAPSRFAVHQRDRATGPLQIVHGDVARSHGYCGCLVYYQRPQPNWCKCYEDRAYRWLLGTEGDGLAIPGVYRIRHARKGHDRTERGNWIRRHFRRLKSWRRERKLHGRGALHV